MHTHSSEQVRFFSMLVCLLKHLVADFVEHSDFLKEKTQTFRLHVQCDATHFSLSYIISLSLNLYILDSDNFLLLSPRDMRLVSVISRGLEKISTSQ